MRRHPQTRDIPPWLPRSNKALLKTMQRRRLDWCLAAENPPIQKLHRCREALSVGDAEMMRSKSRRAQTFKSRPLPPPANPAPATELGTVEELESAAVFQLHHEGS